MQRHKMEMKYSDTGTQPPRSKNVQQRRYPLTSFTAVLTDEPLRTEYNGLPSPSWNTLHNIWPLSRNPFAPLVWRSKSREWVEANVFNSKSNQKIACQMKWKNRWKQEIILVFPTDCTQSSVVSESQYRIIHTDKSRQNPWALRGEN